MIKFEGDIRLPSIHNDALSYCYIELFIVAGNSRSKIEIDSTLRLSLVFNTNFEWSQNGTYQDMTRRRISHRELRTLFRSGLEKE